MTTINIRVEESVKKQATELFEELGLDMSTAMNMFLRQAIRHGGIPFEIKRPNATTLQALQEVEQIRSGKIVAKKYNDVEAMFNELDGEDDD